MTPLPPPTPIDEPNVNPPSSSRRGLVIAAVAATALGVGGVVVGSQLVAADDETTTDEATPIDESEPVESEPVESEPAETEPAETEPADGEPAETEPADDDSDDAFDEEHDGDSEFPMLDELKTAFEEFDRCITEQLPDFEDGGWIDIDNGELPDIGEWDKEFEDLLGGSVTVFSPGAEDGDLTLLNFGDGDGTITVTQTDGSISVSTDGDVETVEAGFPDLGDLDDFDLPDFDFEPNPEVDAAFESCASLLPTDGIFDMVGEFVGELADFGAADE